MYIWHSIVFLGHCINSCNKRHSTIEKRNNAAKYAKFLAELTCNNESIFNYLHYKNGENIWSVCTSIIMLHYLFVYVAS